MQHIFPNTVAPEAVASAVSASGELRVWLDDDLEDRKAWDGWVHVTTVKQAIALLDTERVVELSLDNDLGGDEFGEGKHVVDYLCKQHFLYDQLLWPRDGITLHTANASARDQMARAIERYAARDLLVKRDLTSGGKTRFGFLSAS